MSTVFIDSEMSGLMKIKCSFLDKLIKYVYFIIGFYLTVTTSWGHSSLSLCPVTSPILPVVESPVLPLEYIR